MSITERSNNESVVELTNHDVIDLTERGRNRAARADPRSGLSRPAPVAVPPWRESHTSSIVGPRAEPARLRHDVAGELRSALFETSNSEAENRVLLARKLKLVAPKSDRALGKPHGTFFQRLKKRR